MKSQLFPLLDKRHIDRLLRGGLQIDHHEIDLIHAAGRLAQLGILVTTEVYAVHCVYQADDDFPEEVIDEACEGIVRLVPQHKNAPNQSAQNIHPIYHCPSCGRLIEYPGVTKQVFQLWETTVNQAGLTAYIETAIDTLAGAPTNRSLAQMGLTVVDLLTQDRAWLAKRLGQQSGSAVLLRQARHRERNDLRVLCESLLDAFPTKQLLAQMLRLQLNINLEAIALGENLTEIADKVIIMAETEGWLPDLMEAARRANTGNRRLRQLHVGTTLR